LTNHHGTDARQALPGTAGGASGLRRSARRRRGVTLLDVTIAATLLAVAITSLLSLIISAVRLSRVNHETALATQAAQRTIEQIQAAGFENIFATFNPNAGFAVVGLTPQRGDADGLVGLIQFPTVGAQLREDVVDTGLGMPRDLDGDGGTDAADHAGDYVVLPVRVRVAWRGVSGDRELDLTTMLMDW
jgi:type II secretory pathway pseudopilin PulG